MKGIDLYSYFTGILDSAWIINTSHSSATSGIHALSLNVLLFHVLEKMNAFSIQ